MAIENLLPDAILGQSRLTGTIADIQDDPDAPDANWLLAPEINLGAAKNFYMLGGTLADGYHALRDGGGAPADAYFSPTTGWIVGEVAGANYSGMRTGVERAAASFSATIQPNNEGLTTGVNANAFRTPVPLTGTFAAGDWFFSFVMRSQTAAMLSGQTGQVLMRVYRGTLPDGSDAVLFGSPYTYTPGTGTQVTQATMRTQVVGGTNNTTANHVARTATWAAPAITLAGEYLFFAIGYGVTATTGTGLTRDINLRENLNSRISTPTFVPKEPDGSVRVSFPSPAQGLDPEPLTQTVTVHARKKGSGANPSCQVQLLENGSWLADIGGPMNFASPTGANVNRNWSASLLSDISGAAAELRIITSNTETSSLEIGAIRWAATVVAAGALVRARHDDAEGTDAASRVVGYKRGRTDQSEFSDAAQVARAIRLSVGDAAQGTDQAAPIAARARAAAEQASLTDQRTASLARAQATSEQGALTDAAAHAQGLTRSVTEAGELTDQAALAQEGALVASVTEQAVFTDSAAGVLARARAVSEQAALTDQASPGASRTRAVSEEAALEDDAAHELRVLVALAVSEEATLEDGFYASRALGRVVGEEAAAVDSVVLLRALSRNVGEAATGSDAHVAAMDLERAVSEGAGLSDVASVFVGLLVTAIAHDDAYLADAAFAVLAGQHPGVLGRDPIGVGGGAGTEQTRRASLVGAGTHRSLAGAGGRAGVWPT